MLLETFPVGPLDCNCSILVDSESRAAIVIDPGGHLELINDRLKSLQARVEAIVHTHAHVDHVGATAPLHRSTQAPAYVHEADRFLYDLVPMQAQMIRVEPPELCELGPCLVDGAVVRAGSIELRVVHTPGHSPGGISLLVNHGGRLIAFTGDTLFHQAIGRTDLWGGDAGAIVRSIRERLFALDDDTLVIPGHGPTTTIGDEKRWNPYVRLPPSRRTPLPIPTGGDE